jgi:hypothetical protein
VSSHKCSYCSIEINHEIGVCVQRCRCTSF